MTMTHQPTPTVDGQVRTVPPEPRHRHDTACYWDLDDCRWECVSYPPVRYALEHCTAISRPVTDIGPETRP